MLVVDFIPDVIVKAENMLRSKAGICEITPRVRITIYDNGHNNVQLVCRHTDAGLNCGTAAESCERCLNKEKQYKVNEDFSHMLQDFASRSKLK